ncbi:MAG: TonB family protein [Burkholderiales bacterium]|jgi:protein TonB|nr:TonB family protein [Burkholderiales bacterium]
MQSLVHNNRLLVSALGVSLAVHALALAVRFVDPELLRLRATDPALEVILVNARSQARPSRPEAYAQANLDGGGANEAGRRSSPLPNLMRSHDGETLEMARARTEQAIAQPQKLALPGSGELTVSDAERPLPAEQPLAGSADANLDVLARMQAEISQRISDYQKRPRRHHFMPSTSEYRYARYVEDWRAWVERIGNEHYPEEARGRLYGALRMTVVIGADGRLVQAVIEEPSGLAVLDRAARSIVKLAAPFPPFPPEIARDTDILEITRTWIFTNDKFATRSGERPAAP